MMGTPLDPTIRSHFGDYLDGLPAEAIYNLSIRELLLNAYEAGWKEGVEENYSEDA